MLMPMDDVTLTLNYFQCIIGLTRDAWKGSEYTWKACKACRPERPALYCVHVE